jgi:hypothetical protein
MRGVRLHNTAMITRSPSVLYLIGLVACAGPPRVMEPAPFACGLGTGAPIQRIDVLAGDYRLQLAGSDGSVDVPLTLVPYPDDWRYGTPRFLQLPDTVDPRGGYLAVFNWDSVVSWDFIHRPDPRRLYGWSAPEVSQVGIRLSSPINSHHLGYPGVLVTRDSLLTLAPPPFGFVSNGAHAQLRMLRATDKGFAGEWTQGSPIRSGSAISGTFCALRRAV